MKKQIFIALSCVMFIASGCATQEVVKSQEPGMSQAVAAKQMQAEQPKAVAVKAEPSGNKTSSKGNEAMGALEPVSNTAELKIALEKIYFDFDSAILSKEARQTLVNNAEKIRQASKIMISIEGNCDERGSDEYNLALGERRAQAAMQYLVTLGIPETRLSVISYGKEKPAVAGHDEASWAQNRRDEFVITTK